MPCSIGVEKKVAEPITNYAWSDEGKKVKIYVDLPGVGALVDEAVSVSFTSSSFDILVVGYEGKDRRLAFKALFADVSRVIAKKKPEKIIVTLFKEEEESWPCIAKGTATS